MADSRNIGQVTVAMAIDDTDMLIILRFAAICILFNCSTTLHLIERIKDSDERFFRYAFLGLIPIPQSSGNQENRPVGQDGRSRTGNQTGGPSSDSDDDSPNTTDSSGSYDFYN
jgi:hypothetical protein